MAFVIVIPTLGIPKSLIDLLASIRSQNLIAGHFEVIVVFNPSDLSHFENTQKRLQKEFTDLKLKILISEHEGAAAARETGWREAKHGIVLFLDDDCLLLNSNDLFAIHSAHKESTSLVIGSHYVSPSHSPLSVRSYNCLVQLWLITQSKLNDYPIFPGGAFSIKKSSLTQNIKFNTQIEYGGAEIDFLKRAYAIGQGEYRPDLAIGHQGRVQWRDFVLRAIKQGRHIEHFQIPRNWQSVYRFIWAHKNQLTIIFVMIYLIIGRMAHASHWLRNRCVKLFSHSEERAIASS